jgi:hypothetical protein
MDEIIEIVLDKNGNFSALSNPGENTLQSSCIGGEKNFGD